MGTELARPMIRNDASARQRIDWVDYAKGFCIVMVVMMHSTLGVGQAAGGEGWLHYRRRIRAAVPDAGLLPDLGPVPGAGHRPRLAHLSRPQGRALRLLLSAVDRDPVRAEGARPGAGPWRRRRRLALSRNLLGAVRHALVHLSAADLLRRDQARARAAHPACSPSGWSRRRSRSRPSIPATRSSTSSPAASCTSTPAISLRRASLRWRNRCRRSRKRRSPG